MDYPDEMTKINISHVQCETKNLWDVDSKSLKAKQRRKLRDLLQINMQDRLEIRGDGFHIQSELERFMILPGSARRSRDFSTLRRRNQKRRA